VPIYEFVCENCGRIVERLQKVSESASRSVPRVRRQDGEIMSRNSFQLKGGGWYKDLYSSSSKADAGDQQTLERRAGGGHAVRPRRASASQPRAFHGGAGAGTDEKSTE